jgi:hypothetical protein
MWIMGHNSFSYTVQCRSQRSRSLRRRSAAASLLRLWVRIPHGTCMPVISVVSCQEKSICDELITRLEESYRLWCVVVCDLETSWMRRPLAHWRMSRQKQTHTVQYMLMSPQTRDTEIKFCHTARRKWLLHQRTFSQRHYKDGYTLVTLPRSVTP